MAKLFLTTLFLQSSGEDGSITSLTSSLGLKQSSSFSLTASEANEDENTSSTVTPQQMRFSEDPFVFEIFVGLCNTLTELGQYDEAEQYAKQILQIVDNNQDIQILESRHGNDDETVESSTSSSRPSNTEQAVGRNRARKVIHESVSPTILPFFVQEASNNTKQLESLRQLAIALFSVGRSLGRQENYDEAVPFLRRCHSFTSTMSPEIRDQQNDDALSLVDVSIMCESYLGHVLGLQLLSKLSKDGEGGVNENENEEQEKVLPESAWLEAYRLLKSSFEKAEKLYGGHHLKTATCARYLAIFLRRKQSPMFDIETAFSLHHQALAIHSAVFQFTDSSQQQNESSAEKIVKETKKRFRLFKKKQSSAVQETQVQSLSDFTKHPLIARDLHDLSALALIEGQWADALLYQKQCVEMYSSCFGFDSSIVMRALYQLARILERAGMFLEAQSVYDQVIKLGKSLYSRQNKTVKMAKAQLKYCRDVANKQRRQEEMDNLKEQWKNFQNWHQGNMNQIAVIKNSSQANRLREWHQQKLTTVKDIYSKRKAKKAIKDDTQ